MHLSEEEIAIVVEKKKRGEGKRCGETFVSIVKRDETKGKKFRFGNEAAAREQIGRKRRRR